MKEMRRARNAIAHEAVDNNADLNLLLQKMTLAVTDLSGNEADTNKLYIQLINDIQTLKLDEMFMNMKKKM